LVCLDEGAKPLYIEDKEKKKKKRRTRPLWLDVQIFICSCHHDGIIAIVATIAIRVSPVNCQYSKFFERGPGSAF